MANNIVFKYLINKVDINTIDMPEGAVILKADMQTNRNIAMWVQCDPDKPLKKRKVVLFFTGEKFYDLLPGESYRYINTFFSDTQFGLNDQLVFHAYEILNPQF